MTTTNPASAALVATPSGPQQPPKSARPDRAGDSHEQQQQQRDRGAGLTGMTTTSRATSTRWSRPSTGVRPPPTAAARRALAPAAAGARCGLEQTQRAVARAGPIRCRPPSAIGGDAYLRRGGGGGGGGGRGSKGGGGGGGDAEPSRARGRAVCGRLTPHVNPRRLQSGFVQSFHFQENPSMAIERTCPSSSPMPWRRM